MISLRAELEINLWLKFILFFSFEGKQSLDVVHPLQKVKPEVCITDQMTEQLFFSIFSYKNAFAGRREEGMATATQI